MLFLLTWTWTLTLDLDDLQVPDLGETISSFSRVSNREETPQTILLQYPRYQSRTVEISSKIIAVSGNVQSRPTILESQQVKGTLLHLTNSTASFTSLAFQPLTARILTVINHSECLVANSVISVIEDVSPIECSDSTVQILNSDFDFSASQNQSPSLSTTASASSTVSFHSCSFSNVVVTSPGSFICCSSVQTSQTDHCHFSNISHCPSFCKPSQAPLFHNVSVMNTHFVDCENVLFGGVVRDTEDRTSLLAANTTFTRSRSTYTNRTGEPFGPTTTTTAQIVSVDHRYQQCTFTQCVSLNQHGGGIRCNSGANLAVDNCTFEECRATHNSNDFSCDGGGIFIASYEGSGGASITRSVFSNCQAIYGGGIRMIQPTSLIVQYCNTSHCYAIDTFPGSIYHPWGGGIGLSGMPLASVLSNVRFEDCKATATAGCLDNNEASGSIIYSNLLFAHGECRDGNVICSSVTDNDAEIAFFSCTFFSNVANGSREGTVNGTTKTMASGNDIRFRTYPIWERVLKDKSSFVNCFSTSAFPRIVIIAPFFVDFTVYEAGNLTLLDIHLPTPGVVVSTEAGNDEPGCGSDSYPKCQSIGFTGANRLANAFTSVLVEGGRYEETLSFNVAEKPASFSSNGDEHPVVSFDPQSGEDRFMELGVGMLSLSLFTFVPCETASIVKVVGAGPLTIESCEFQNEDGLTPIVQTSIIKMTEGTAFLKNVKFIGIEFSQGSIVRCEGDVTKLEIQESVFTGLHGTAGPLISFERLSEGGELIINKAKLHGNAVSDCVGGITTANVKTVTVTSTTFAHLTDGTQKAALSICSCMTTLTLSDLVFEDCSGSDASSLFVASSVTLTSPISNSISTTDTPISSVDGDTTTVFIPKPNALTIDPSEGSAEVFCWTEATGCVSLSCLAPRIGKGHTWLISAADGTSLESLVSLDDKTLLVAGSGESSTTFQHSGEIDSSLIVQTSGSLALSDIHFSILPTHATTTRSASFFSISDGSLSLTSVSFTPMSFSDSNSLIKLTGAASLTLDAIDFSGITTEGSGSVFHSTSTGTITLSSVSFSSCNCGESQKGRSVFIERSFDAGCVSMTSVQVSSAVTIGSHDIFLKGSNIVSTVTESWESLIGAEDTLTSAVMDRVVGEEDGSEVKSGPLAYLLYPFIEGSMHVDGSFWDHENCGKEKLPCKSFENVHSKLNAFNQEVVFLSAYTLTGEINSLELGSVLTTKLTQTVSTDQSTQFFVQNGPLSFEAINLFVPTTITKPLFVVKASVLSIASTVTIQNPSSASTHQAPLFSLASGTLQMTGTQLIFQPTFISTKSLIEQTAGNLELNSVTIQNVSKSTGDGSVLHSTLSSTSDKVQISGTTSFKDCHSTVGNGGVLFISCPQSFPSSSLVIDATFSDCSCGQDMKGECVFVRGHTFKSLIIPEFWTKAITGLTWDSPNTLWGTDTNEEENSVYHSISLLYHLVPYRQHTIHVGAGGRNENGCGSSTWKCLTLNQAHTHLSGSTPFTLSIDTEASHSDGLAISSETTVKGHPATSKLLVGATGSLSVSASTLSLSTLVLDGSSVSRTSSYLTLSQTGSLDINHCTFTGFTSTTDGAVFSSALGAGNSVTIANTAFTSCTSDGNGGALAITLNGGSLTLTDTNVTFSSCDGLKGKNVYLAGTGLDTLLAEGGLDGIKPSLPTNDIFGDEEMLKWFGMDTGVEASSGSLLYYWYPHIDTATSTHVHSSGTDHPLCGIQALPSAKFLLDSKLSLNEDVTIASTATITSNTAGRVVDVQRDRCFSITANTLSVESLSFTTTVPSFDRSLFTITNTGSLTLSTSNFTGFSTTVAGSVVSGTVATSVLIKDCVITQCHSTEIGGVVSVSLTGSGTISISDNTFSSCTSSKNEGHLGSISSTDLITFLKTDTLSSIKPSIPENGIFGEDEKSKWFGINTGSDASSGSLLYYWYPHLDTATSTHVHSSGTDHPLCGIQALSCSVLSSALQKTTVENKTIIDSAFLLTESISEVFGAHTLTSASPLHTVTIGGEASITLTANSLTLQMISFTQSPPVQALNHPLISVTSASITIDHCTFSKFTMTDSALIQHTGSILSVSGGSFKGITRRQGEGAVLASTFTDGMELHVDGVTLDTVASETGLADGLFISFLDLTTPSHSTPFSLTNLVFKQSSSSNADSSHFVCIVGNDFSTWITTEDPRFAGSYESLPSDSWLWSVDKQTELSGSVVFYLKEGTGPVGVSDAGYLISKCGYYSVWCKGLKYGLERADSRNQVQINIHDTVTLVTLIDLNEEYRIHGKLSSSVIVLTQNGGFVIDSGEEVMFDGMTLKVAGNADRSALEVLDGHFHLKNARVVVSTVAALPFFHCQDSQLTFESVVIGKLAPISSHDEPAVSQTLIKLDRTKMSFVDITLESELPAKSTFLEISNGTTELNKLHLSPTIKTVAVLVSMNGGSFSLVDLSLNAVAITSTPFVFSEVTLCTLTNLTASELPSAELIHIDSSDSFTLQSCSFRGESEASSHLNEDTLCSWSTGLISINSTPTTIRGSEFTSLGQGALIVNGSKVSVATSEFMINSAGNSEFPSAHRNIRCKEGNVTFVDLSSGDGVNNTSLWISGENCEVRVKEEKIISPFFQPAFDAEKSSSKQEKNKTLTVTLVAGLLIPCGLQIEIYESSKESDHISSFMKLLTPSTTTSFTEEKVILSLSPTEVASKLNASEEWKGRIVTRDEQRSSSFVVKRSLSDERKSQAIQAMKWVIPVVCAVLALLFVIILLIVLCRRRRQKKATEKKDKEELNDVQDEKIEVLNDDLLYPATSLVNAVPSHAPLDKEDDTEPKLTQQANPSHHPDTQAFTSVEVVKVEHGVQVGQINKRDTLYNRLHSNQKQPISKGMTAQQIVRSLMKLYNVNSALDLFTRFSSHVVLFDKDGQVYLDMNRSNPAQPAVPLVEGQPIAQAQPATDSNLTQTSPFSQREGFEMMRWRAPETIVERGEEKKDVRPDQAAVFSLGLVLYEIETGLVPFGELDAVNASRQLRTGCLPKMELVGSDDLSILIAECLSLDGKNRPKLDSLESRLASISFKADFTPNLLEFT
ncbi:hypothetical protein BLNAU_8068 [Blattamonas nauphoetae]|uniref:Protein kinase domain-containing protein n=1 Tax=Blattamonas nauphoetae TaxID=2049346 RepID=A0ABQ9XZV2_9EUKA|nr:hypothetical protein BLNAU_8068 [Blattamonas nauphoetae]